MNDLKIFNNEEFGEIRTVVVNDEPMFCLTDICKALEIKNATDVAKRLDEDERTRLNLGRQGETNFITESGLYAVILRSDKPNAKKFRKWVTSEVLPSIRKTGSYNKPMTTAEKIHLLAQGNEELNLKVDKVEAEVKELKDTMPLLAVDCDLITKAVKTKGVEVLGGKDSNSYKDRSLRSRVYADIHREVKRQFGVTTYKAIKRNQCEKAVAFVRNYNVPFVLQEQIAENNAQLNLVV
jgi:prophage antirepressor-like protein|nr:MAG TPA: repressor domain protein [Caudoviricetes sp.]